MRKCSAAVPYDARMHFFRRHDKGRLPHQDVLTPAEWRVLEHVRQRRTNAEIAVRVGVSVNTVRTHVSSMLAKLEVHDREELARWMASLRRSRVSRSSGGVCRSERACSRGCVTIGRASAGPHE